MRAAILLLVSSLLFGSLAVNWKAMSTRFFRLLIANSGSQPLFTARPKSNPNQPEKPAPHRGSGRKESIENFGIIHFAV